MTIMRTLDTRLLFGSLPLDGWGGVARGKIEFHDFPCSHNDLVLEPAVRLLAEKTAKSLSAAEDQNAGPRK